MTRVQELLAAMTAREKASLCSGQDSWHLKDIERLGIPSIMITDGPHGLRKQTADSSQVDLTASVPATCFPTASALAATWNRDLVYRVGEALAEECLAEKVAVILGPGANIKRSPLCGRNFEYFSEDPYLTGQLAKAYVHGIQSKGIGASLKHYAANNQETRRMSIDAIVDERALREIYLAGFETAVREAQPATVMCAYNRLNGTYCSEHRRLLTDILRREWGHSGVVVSDWGAIDRRVASLAAGVDLEMPGSQGQNDARIVAAVETGELDEAVLDQAVERLLSLILGAADALAADASYDPEAHHSLARQIAAEGVVLLKNDDGILPLRENVSVALLGAFAKSPRYQGAGSSLINPYRLESIHDEFIKLAGTERTVLYADGYPLAGSAVDGALLAEAKDVAARADLAVVCVGLPDIAEVEGVDRKHMRLPESHGALIEAVAATNSNIVVVLLNGSPVEMPWAAQVKGILEGYLGGQAGGGAIVDILTGHVNPSGKLAETFPLRLEDDPSQSNFPGGPKTVEYRESIYVGYRYYDSARKEVRFPFGHGLSYTSFEYSNLELSASRISDADGLRVEVTVRNTETVAGKETIQLYVRDITASVFRPEKELKGFAKVSLAPAEAQTVTFELNRRAFAFYDTASRDWQVEGGQFEILIGASSRDIRLTGTVEVASTRDIAIDPAQAQRLQAYYAPATGFPVERSAFEALCGRTLPSNEVTRGEEYTLNTPIADLRRTMLGRFLYNAVRRRTKELDTSPTSIMARHLIEELPLRGMVMVSGGKLTYSMLEGVLMILNHRFLRGFATLLTEFRRKENSLALVRKLGALFMP